MSDGMNPEQIERVFGALARIEQKIDSHVDTVAAHVAHDETVQKALFERVETLQFAQAKQKGALTVLGAVGSALGAGAGYLIERWTSGHH
jgi:hypothetical protein